MNDQLRSIAGAHPSLWRKWRQEIFAILADLRPELEALYAARMTRRSVILEVGARGSAAASAKRARERIEKNRTAPAAGAFAVPRLSSEGSRTRVERRGHSAVERGFVD